MIFEELGFNMAELNEQLALIKAMHDKRKDSPDAVSVTKKRVATIQKAALKLEAALGELDSGEVVSIFGGVSPPLVHELQRIQRLKVNILTEPGRAKPSYSTQNLNVVTARLARIYKNQTGRECTINVDVPAGNIKGGKWLEFLDACADRLDVTAFRLKGRAQQLRKEGKI